MVWSWARVGLGWTLGKISEWNGLGSGVALAVQGSAWTLGRLSQPWWFCDFPVVWTCPPGTISTALVPWACAFPCGVFPLPLGYWAQLLLEQEFTKTLGAPLLLWTLRVTTCFIYKNSTGNLLKVFLLNSCLFLTGLYFQLSCLSIFQTSNYSAFYVWCNTSLAGLIRSQKFDRLNINSKTHTQALKFKSLIFVSVGPGLAKYLSMCLILSPWAAPLTSTKLSLYLKLSLSWRILLNWSRNTWHLEG